MNNKDVDIMASKADGGIYRDIPLINLNRFNDHAFVDYKGVLFDLLVESISTKGLIHPIVVRPLGDNDDYEILSGHNRKSAAEILGWSTIPAIIRTMSDEEAVLFANEANVAQRRFENWLPSEKAKSISQYYTGIKKQGCRLRRERLTSGEDYQKFDARKETARVYRVSENTVRLYLDLYRLVEPLKKRLDKEEFGTTSAQALSSVPSEIQELVNIVIEEDKDICEITVTNARKVRDEYKSYEDKDTDEAAKVKDDIRKLLSKASDTSDVETDPVVIIEMKAEIYEMLFPGQDPNEVVVKEIVEAIEFQRTMFHMREKNRRQQPASETA